MTIKTIQTTVITLVLKQSKPDPELLDKIAGRAYTLDGVEAVDAVLIGEFKGEPKQAPYNQK